MLRLSWVVLLLVAMSATLHPLAAEPEIVVRRPTVIAFIEPVTDRELEKYPDTSETLGDFQEYVSRSRGPLMKSGVDFHVVYARAFLVRDGRHTRTFRTGRLGVG